MGKQPFISHAVNGYSRYDVPESKALRAHRVFYIRCESILLTLATACLSNRVLMFAVTRLLFRPLIPTLFDFTGLGTASAVSPRVEDE